uniref:Uncharacterized protein n=1 Tax=Avena sativa TaxID=4498 RepID=A0ACD5ZD80_AVESA
MSEKVATGILSGVVKVTGYVSSSLANSKAGKKFFSLLPGEIVLASLDGFGKICDFVEVAGKDSTSSTVITGLVSHKYILMSTHPRLYPNPEHLPSHHAFSCMNEEMEAAGYAIGTAWAVFKIRQAINLKNVLNARAADLRLAKSSNSK